jgi:long-chain fatty acid transport protein
MQKKMNQPVVKYLKTKPVTVLLFLGMTFSILMPPRITAVGFRLPNQDPEAIARGNAFAATADDPSAIYYNPAGITQLKGQNLRVGIYAVSAGIKYNSAAGSATAKSDLQPVPQVYYVDSFANAPVSIGLGIYAPYGLSVDWGNSAPFNTVGERGKVIYLCFNPVIAWRITPTLSIGAGPTINYSQASFEQAIPPFFLFPAGGQSKVEGDNMDFGFNAGILWQPHSKWSFGVNYRSATIINYQGTASQSGSVFVPSSTAASAAIRYPQFVVGGISFRPTPKWNLESDVDWTDWSDVKQINVINTPLGNQTLPLHYQSSFMYEFGITRQFGHGYFGSVGYFYSENSSPDANFNPLIPDANLQLGSIGFGYHGKRWDWAAAYHFGYNGGRTVSNDTANPSANGTYKTFNNGFNVATTFKF